MRVIAIDPGVTTGYVLAMVSSKRIELFPRQQKFTYRAFQAFLERNATGDTIVICEDFEFRQRARAGLDLTPAHLIGIVYAHVGDDKTNLYIQKPGYAIGQYFTDSRLKSLNIYIPGQPHAMDALRHFMQWFRFGPGYKYFEDQQLILVKP